MVKVEYAAVAVIIVIAVTIIAATAIIDDNPTESHDGIASLTGVFVDGVLIIDSDSENGFRSPLMTVAITPDMNGHWVTSSILRK